MAQYIAFDKNVQVNGQTILSVINALEIGKEMRQKILEDHNMNDIQPDKWYSQQGWLDAFKDIAEKIGEKTLYIIGKAIPKNAKFPPEINDLHKALQAIDMAYHMNHQGGEIGSYKVDSFDEKNKKAVVVCNNPYPSEFDRGIIMAMVSRFRPTDSIRYDVHRDLTKESRVNGANSCTYIVSW